MCSLCSTIYTREMRNTWLGLSSYEEDMPHNILYTDGTNFYLYSKCDDHFYNENTETLVKYCPICGRKLVDESPDVDFSEGTACIDSGEISDGYHTFNQLYHQRAILFAAIVNQNKDKSWKSYKHSDGKYCFDSNGEWFIVGIDTPEGSYTYHYSKEYWDYFECKELDCGKEWDGHTEDDVTRLLSLASVEPERKPGKWVPIRTKSPQNGQRIFISTIKGTIHDVVWNTDCIHNYARNGCWYRNWFVVAWMPFFIKSYKAESDDRNEI